MVSMGLILYLKKGRYLLLFASVLLFCCSEDKGGGVKSSDAYYDTEFYTDAISGDGTSADISSGDLQDLSDLYIVDSDLYPDGGFEFITGTAYYEPVETEIPPKGVWFKDLNFRTAVARITDKKKDGYSGTGIQNEYSRSDPENADGSRLILRGNDGEWYLYSTQDFSLIRKLEGINGGGQEPEPRWDNLDPDIFYYFYGSELRSYNISHSKSETLHDFRKENLKVSLISTGTEGDASYDRRYWCLMLLNDSYELLNVVVYDRSEDKVLGLYNSSSLPEGVGLNWTSMDISGESCLFGYEDIGAGYTPPVGVFERNLTMRLSLPDGANGHMDVAIDENGRDVMIYQNNSTDWIAMADLKSGAETNLIEIPFGINADIGLHFSGNNYESKGWVLVSTYGSRNTPSGSRHSWMDNQLFLVQLRQNPLILRIAHTHSYTSLNYEGEKNYFAECFASISRSSANIYFGSNWNNYSFEYSDAYVVRLPPKWWLFYK